MSNFNATTPQLKVVKNFIDAFLSRDIKSVYPLVAKNYTFQTYPKAAERSDETKEAHLQRYGMMLAAITKIEARMAPGNCLRAHKLTFTATSQIFTK